MGLWPDEGDVRSEVWMELGEEPACGPAVGSCGDEVIAGACVITVGSSGDEPVHEATVGACSPGATGGGGICGALRCPTYCHRRGSAKTLPTTGFAPYYPSSPSKERRIGKGKRGIGILKVCGIGGAWGQVWQQVKNPRCGLGFGGDTPPIRGEASNRRSGSRQPVSNHLQALWPSIIERRRS
jgi:hypothetical protein